MPKSLYYFSILFFFLIFVPILYAQTSHAELIFDGNGKERLNANETVAVNIDVDSGSESVNALDVRLTYPADKLGLTDLNTEDSDFEIKADEKIESGIVTIVRGTTEPKDGVNKVAEIKFKALSNVNLNEISYTPDSVVMSIDGKNILSGSKIVAVPADIEEAETNPSGSFWDNLKAWNAGFWEAIFSFFGNIFGGN